MLTNYDTKLKQKTKNFNFFLFFTKIEAQRLRNLENLMNLGG